MSRKNLALELLKRLLNDEIKNRKKTNLIQGKKFSELLAAAVKRYQNGLIDSARIIEKDVILFDEKEIKVAISVGVSEIIRGDTPDKLVKDADLALSLARPGRSVKNSSPSL